MTSITLPCIVSNLGVEMVYILAQRLEAQKILDDKAAKVINDVLRTMFTPALIDELMKPQDLYTIPSIRLLFDRVVHSSIMRLNEQSMDKLYDLILMGLKYQVLACTRPDELLLVTQRHFDHASALCTDELTGNMIGHATKRVMATLADLSLGEWIELRHRVLAFLQNKRVKVSLFLQEGIQAQDGRFHLPPPLVPKGTRGGVVGCCRFFNEAGQVIDQHVFEPDSVIKDVSFYLLHPEPPGSNLYRPHRDKAPAVTLPTLWRNPQSTPPRAGTPLDATEILQSRPTSMSTTSTFKNGGGSGGGGGDRRELGSAGSMRVPLASVKSKGVMLSDADGLVGNEEAQPQRAVEHMRALTSFLGRGGGGGGADFKLNLFASTVDAATADAANFATEDVSSNELRAEEALVRTMVVDSKHQRDAYMQQGRLADVMKELKVSSGGKAPPPTNGGGDDLLDLMDSIM